MAVIIGRRELLAALTAVLRPRGRSRRARSGETSGRMAR